MWPSSSGPAGSWVAGPSWTGCGCGLGAHAGLRRALVDQEPPLLHHHGRPAAGPGRLRQAPPSQGRRPLDAWGRAEDDQAVIVVATWTYVGAGYATEGERWLALSAAARAREQRRVAREELTTTTHPMRCMTLQEQGRTSWTRCYCRAGRRAAGHQRAVRAAAGVRAPHRLRQARPSRPHRRPRPGRLHRRRTGRRGRAALAETGSLTMAHIEQRMRGGQATYRARYRDPDGRRARQDVRPQGRRPAVPGEMENAKLRGAWTNPALGRVLFAAWLEEWRGTRLTCVRSTVARDEWLFQLVHPAPLRRGAVGRHRAAGRAGVGGRAVGRGWTPATVVKAYQLLGRTMMAARQRRHDAPLAMPGGAAAQDRAGGDAVPQPG